MSVIAELSLFSSYFNRRRLAPFIRKKEPANQLQLPIMLMIPKEISLAAAAHWLIF